MKKLMLVLLLSALGCVSGVKEPEPVIRPQPGAELCPQVCEKGRYLPEMDGDAGCVWTEDIPIDGGVLTCEEWCVQDHADGVYWNSECIVEKATTCEEVETMCNIQ